MDVGDDEEVVFKDKDKDQGSISTKKSVVSHRKQARRFTNKNKISINDKKQIKESINQIRQALSSNKRSPYIPQGISIPSSYMNSPKDSSLNLPALSQNNSLSRNPISVRSSIESSRNYKIYDSIPRNIPNIKLKGRKKPANRISLKQPFNGQAKKDLKNSIFRNHRKRYSQNKGINLKSYKVNVYNIGVNATLGNSSGNDSTSPRNNYSKESIRTNKVVENRPYYKIISRSALKDSLNGLPSHYASRLAKE